MSDSENPKNSKKRRTITFEQKIDIIKKAEKGEKLASIGRKFGLSRSTINTIVKDKERIKMHVRDGINIRQISAARPRSGIMEEMERLLKLWIDDQNQRNVPLSLALIQQKAKQIHADIKQISGKGTRESEIFNASWGWYRRFKIRANLQNLKITGEETNPDIKEFCSTLHKIIEDGGYSAQQIFIVDETDLFWKKIPGQACISDKEKSVSCFNASNDRLTLLLGGNAKGDYRLTPMMVYHSGHPRALRSLSKVSLPIIWKTHPKAWVTTEIFDEWFRYNFIPEAQNYCQKENIHFKVLLVLDNAPGHCISCDINPNVKVVYLPANATTLLQPMEQHVIASFKKQYLRTTIAEISKAFDEGNTLSEYWEDFNIYQAAQNIASSWSKITQTNMNKAWNNLYPRFVSNSNIEQNPEEVIDEIVEMGRNLQFDINKRDIIDLLKSRAEELTTNDLIQLQEQIKTHTEKVEDIYEEISSPTSETLTLKTLNDVFTKVNELVDFVRKSDPDDERSSNVIENIHNSIAGYKTMYQEMKNATAAPDSMEDSWCPVEVEVEIHVDTEI